MERLTQERIYDAIKYVRRLGVGEILLSSIDQDGSGEGYDKNIIDCIKEKIDFPIIINSGATKLSTLNMD